MHFPDWHWNWPLLQFSISVTLKRTKYQKVISQTQNWRGYVWAETHENIQIIEYLAEQLSFQKFKQNFILSQKIFFKWSLQNSAKLLLMKIIWWTKSFEFFSRARLFNHLTSLTKLVTICNELVSRLPRKLWLVPGLSMQMHSVLHRQVTKLYVKSCNERR